jgi:hypothetical protein
MFKKLLPLLFLFAGFQANAALIKVSFQGLVDGSEAQVGGVFAPLSSAFSLDMLLDDTGASVGTYGISSLSYTTTVGTYNTVSAWNPLTAAGTGAGMSLSSGGFQDMGEHLMVRLSNFGVGSVFDDILSWDGAAISGDIIVRGFGDWPMPDQLSGVGEFSGTLSVSASAVPTPGTLALMGLGLAGLGFARRRKVQP